MIAGSQARSELPDLPGTLIDAPRVSRAGHAMSGVAPAQGVSFRRAVSRRSFSEAK